MINNRGKKGGEFVTTNESTNSSASDSLQKRKENRGKVINKIETLRGFIVVMRKTTKREFLFLQTFLNKLVMKKIFFGSIAVIAIAAISAWNLNINSNGFSDVSLANVEALADETNPGKGILMDIINKKTGEWVGFCCCPGDSNCASSSCNGGC